MRENVAADSDKLVMCSQIITKDDKPNTLGREIIIAVQGEALQSRKVSNIHLCIWNGWDQTSFKASVPELFLRHTNAEAPLCATTTLFTPALTTWE